MIAQASGLLWMGRGLSHRMAQILGNIHNESNIDLPVACRTCRAYIRSRIRRKLRQTHDDHVAPSGSGHIRYRISVYGRREFQVYRHPQYVRQNSGSGTYTDIRAHRKRRVDIRALSFAFLGVFLSHYVDRTEKIYRYGQYQKVATVAAPERIADNIFSARHNVAFHDVRQDDDRSFVRAPRLRQRLL